MHLLEFGRFDQIGQISNTSRFPLGSCVKIYIYIFIGVLYSYMQISCSYQGCKSMYRAVNIYIYI